MDPDPHYHHLPITDSDTIRLIHLDPSPSLSSPVHCSLKHTTLSACSDDIVEHYIALSYVWGDQLDQRIITVDGKRLSITASLECALRHIRDEERVVRVWADGVCIDQGDVQDRNRQVRRMGRIYEVARHTVIFLGTSGPECDGVLRAITSGTFVPREQEGISLSSEFDAIIRRDIFSHPWFTREFDAIIKRDILSQPWFTRVWVLQELVLSADPWIQKGTVRVRWDQFYHHVFGRTDPASQDEIREHMVGMQKIRDKHRSAAKYARENESISILLDILNIRRGSGVSDPRDMIYGHLGMTGTHVQSMIPIDYDKPIAQLYEDIAIRIISEDRNLSILSCVEKADVDERRGDLPSWVPDWTVAHTVTSSSTPSEEENHFTLSTMVSFRIPHVLAVKGYCYGSVKAVIPGAFLNTVKIGGIFEPTRQELLNWFLDPGSQQAVKIILSFYKEMCQQKCEIIRQVPVISVQGELRLILISLVTDMIKSLPDKDHQIRGNLVLDRWANLLYLHARLLARCYSAGRAIAMLDTLSIAQVLPSTRVGHALCMFLDSRRLIILRPEEMEIPLGLKLDLLSSDFRSEDWVDIESPYISYFHPSPADVVSYRYVTNDDVVWGNAIESEWFPGNRPRRERRIFALH
ncbi:hypothetical protein EG329_007424 [Mollisiaceae sp. DMI_Dod_QoI]|nr:hypothetical protein EG329_007424 [Helotiales sp. DMI_Dod_QoI]